jgi:hypothetical protein
LKENGIKMKVRDIFEGMWVAKSLDGVEKRFKRQEDANAWQNSKVKSSKPSASKQNKEEVLSFVWNVISTVDGWGEIDAHDIIKLKIIPRLASKGDELGEKFADAVQEARSRGGTWDRLYTYLDGAVRYAKAGKSFIDWAEEQTQYANNITNR